MLNLLSYVGMHLRAELCLWALLGLVRTIFDAALFKVNANLKQVWQMSMPAQLSMPVQRVLRTIISSVMLVQCFTVYVYLAAYIVLLYPIFLEERPTLVLPWLLLAAVRRLLCELTSLAVGLGACLLLGPARPACVRFLILKITSITPAFYMWMLVYSYYKTLKVASTFKMSPTALPSNDPDYGLELAVRRRKTKSLLGEEQLRRKLVSNFNYGERYSIPSIKLPSPRVSTEEPSLIQSNQTSQEILTIHEVNPEVNPLLITSEQVFPLGVQIYEDWAGNEIPLPRDADRILEQFAVMLIRISAFIKTGKSDPAKLFVSSSVLPVSNLDLAQEALHSNTETDTETPLLVGDSRPERHSASYIHDYPQIFNKRLAQNQIKTPSTSIEPLLKKVVLPDKIDELSEHQLEDRHTSAIRSGEITKKHSKHSNERVKIAESDAQSSKTEKATDGREATPEDSLQSIIDRMKNSLLPDKDSNLPRRNERHTTSERPSTSRDSTNTRRSIDEDKKNR